MFRCENCNKEFYDRFYNKTNACTWECFCIIFGKKREWYTEQILRGNDPLKKKKTKAKNG